MRNSALFLGIDGGQSHTEAVIADGRGNVLARGFGGASNHAEQPGGRERLQNAILGSVGEALQKAGQGLISETVFASAYCAMTGGADYKEEIIAAILKAEKLIIAHDAPAALFGSTAGQPGIVVIAGTGSVVYGENERGEIARAGGLGYLFTDEGSGFWLALQMIKTAIKEQDGLLPENGTIELVLQYFQRKRIREITTDFYNQKISRDELASLAKAAHEAAVNGNDTARAQIKSGAAMLVENVKTVAKRLCFEKTFPVAGVGGMFRGELVRQYFAASLEKELPEAEFIAPRFNPGIGALLLAYRQAQLELNNDLLTNLENSQIK